MTLRFTPEHGPHEPIMRRSVFSAGPGRWILRVWAPDDRRGEAEYPTQEAAMRGVHALYAKLTHQHTVPSPAEQVVIALLPGYIPL